MIRIELYIVIAFLFGACTQGSNNTPIDRANSIDRVQKVAYDATNMQEDSLDTDSCLRNFKRIGEFSVESEVTGIVWVLKGEDKQHFTSLIITPTEFCSDTLYFISGTQFYTEDHELDIAVATSGFYGYTAIQIEDSTWNIVMVDEYGEESSDDIRLSWNDRKKKFAVEKYP